MIELRSRKLIGSACVFAASLFVSLVAWHHAHTIVAKHSAQRFEIAVSHLQDEIEDRLATYEQVLRGGAGLFNGSHAVTRADWRRYVETLRLEEHFPGIQGLGFSEWVGDRTKLAAHEQNIQAEGFTDYAIKPAGIRDHYTSIIYLEPFDERNRQAFGYDMFSEPVRRQAMQRARDTGQSALTGKVELVQEITDDKQAGFLLYVPLYSTANVPATAIKRRDTFIGFVYSPFRAADLMRGILHEDATEVSFQIYDGDPLGQKALLYDGANALGSSIGDGISALIETKTLEIYGRQWTIRFASTPALNALQDSVFPNVLLVAGILLSVLVTVIAWMLFTARQRVEVRTAQLSQQEALNSQLLEDLAEGVVACDANRKLTLFNKKAREWHGDTDLRDVPADGWSTHFALYEEDGVTLLSPERIPLVRAFNGERVTDVGMRIAVKGGQVRHVLANGGPLVDSQGRQTGAVVTMRDVTERKRAAAEIERQQQFMRDVIDHNPSFIFARDHTGRFVLANRAGAESYGVTPEEVLGKTNADFTSDDAEVALILEEDRRIFEDGEHIVGEKKIIDAQGRTRWFHIVKCPLRAPNGRDSLVLAVSADITERKGVEERITALNHDLEERVNQRTDTLRRLNDQLSQSKEEADEANRAKSSFLAAMSHEIRTPMNGVIGMVDVLMNEPLEKDQADAVRTIRDSAFSLLAIIDDILDFSKVEAGRLELERVAVPVSDTVESVVRAMVPLAIKKNVDVSLFIDPGVPDRVYSDLTRLRQVITNIAGNAVKFSGNFSDRRGEVSVRVTVACAEPLSLRFDITDNGIGMTAATRDHIFSSFAQAESSTTRRFGGTGLGLAISRRLVELMGGEILVNSTLDVGSTFSVLLPCNIAPPGEAIAYEDLSGIDCLLISTGSANVEDLKTYLEHAGASATIEEDVSAAARTASTMVAPIVVLQATVGDDLTALHAAFAGVADVRHLLLTRGQRHRARVQSHNVLALDQDGLRRRALIEAVAIAAGRASPKLMQRATEDKPCATVVVPSIASARVAGQLILVAEDDEINVKVIRRQLALLGYAAEFASNGAEALVMWRRNTYGLLLTDLHMPEMDGYTLARLVRQEERAARMPIVALTANALKGEMVKAKAAGVDEYLTKPLELQLLKKALERFLAPVNQAVEVKVTENQPQPTGQKAFDVQVLANLVGDDDAIIEEFLIDYVHAADDVAAQVISASETGDWETVGQLAHRLKSSSRSVGALVLGDVCEHLEAACKATNADLITGDVARLATSLDVVRSEIMNFLQRPEASQNRKAS